ncbi:hypothetical protein GCK72_005362 [Caenorhabditis remanei]|uniref:Uncharacterized protein n=1 Tax=Caenorhabditis remanei TaxID=31234 RepID=A0A6A5HCD6_CAERE|nr:hypothetical protein GCK72_005362 [Caenorhabditis remanei]KAF1765410.1 hypothetical protein GCK72_005362 [Caenorhabditis remanei]
MDDVLDSRRDPGSSTGEDINSSSSLLDILIKTEEPSDETDPLDQFGDISEAVIGQISGSLEMSEDLMQNALKMFGDAMDYKPITPITQKRKRIHRESQISDVKPTLSPLPCQPVESVKKIRKNDPRSVNCPRSNYSVDYTEIFQKEQKTDFQFKTFHQQLEKERTRRIDEQVNKDVERLLNSATRIYGPKEWTSEEKTEFSSYCRNLRTGSLNEEDRNNLQNFYAKAYQQDYQSLLGASSPLGQKEVKETLASSSAICLPMKEDNHIFVERVKQEVINSMPAPLTLSCLLNHLDEAQKYKFDPGMKYEREKQFRYAATKIFKNVVNSRKIFTPEDISRGPDNRRRFESSDIKSLVTNINGLMNEQNKVWSPDQVQQLGDYYNIFIEKQHFNIVQTKDLGKFLRKIYGRLQQYEIERENDTVLQEKRKYWQEYAKTHAPPAKKTPGRKPIKWNHPVRAYNKSNVDTTGETLEEKKLRKAAYLRQWRLAQKEKKYYSNMFGSVEPLQK